MRITLCARSKILEILEPGTAFRVQATAVLFAGQHIDLIPHSECHPSDCIISYTPLVVADIETSTRMANEVIDFDYDSGEFIISNRDKR